MHIPSICTPSNFTSFNISANQEEAVGGQSWNVCVCVCVCVWGCAFVCQGITQEREGLPRNQAQIRNQCVSKIITDYFDVYFLSLTGMITCWTRDHKWATQKTSTASESVCFRYNYRPLQCFVFFTYGLDHVLNSCCSSLFFSSTSNQSYLRNTNSCI